MARNKMEDLRDHLFETIERLKDEDEPMEIDRAKAIGKVADSIIESAKVEVDFLRVTGGIEGTGFIPDGHRPEPRLVTEGKRKS